MQVKFDKIVQVPVGTWVTSLLTDGENVLWVGRQINWALGGDENPPPIYAVNLNTECLARTFYVNHLAIAGGVAGFATYRTNGRFSVHEGRKVVKSNLPEISHLAIEGGEVVFITETKHGKMFWRGAKHVEEFNIPAPLELTANVKTTKVAGLSQYGVSVNGEIAEILFGRVANLNHFSPPVALEDGRIAIGACIDDSIEIITITL